MAKNQNQNKQVLSAELVFDATKWCQENGVRIYPHPVDSGGKILKIIVEENHKPKLGEQTYNNDNVYQKIEQLYVFIYEREQKKMQA